LSNKNKIILHSSEKLTIKFDEPIKEIEKEGKLTRSKLKSNSSYTSDGRVWINKDDVSHLLATDKKGANIIYNDLDDDDKLENGNTKNISIEAIQKEVSKRIQEPRDTLKKERLKDTEKCLPSMRDAPELEKIRELEESRIRKELPRVKAKKLKAETLDCITKEPLVKPEVHHKNRIADKPREALDDENLAAINDTTHGVIHQEGYDTKEGFEKYSEKYK